MYFVKYQPLKQRLRSRSVSDREAVPYLVAFTGLTALEVSLPMMDGFNVWDGVFACLSVAAAIVGALYAYWKNGGNAGFDLIQKFVILSWVVSVRLGLVFIPAALVFVIAGDLLGFEMLMDDTGPSGIVMIILAEVIFYQRLGRHIADTREISGATC